MRLPARQDLGDPRRQRLGEDTILRLIGGLVRPQSGAISVAGHDISRLSETEMYTVRQKLGMMFQGGALLDSLTIFDNLAFPLREHTRLREAGDRRRSASPAAAPWASPTSTSCCRASSPVA